MRNLLNACFFSKDGMNGGGGITPQVLGCNSLSSHDQPEHISIIGLSGGFVYPRKVERICFDDELRKALSRAKEKNRYHIDKACVLNRRGDTVVSPLLLFNHIYQF